MILADTNALIWFLREDDALGRTARRIIEDAQADDTLVVSAFSFWEVALLIARRRLKTRSDPVEFRQRVLSGGAMELPVTGAIGIAAVALDLPHGDPADRIIVATALAHDATLLTADRRLLDWGGRLKRHDARV